jgi:hypothetical protein
MAVRYRRIRQDPTAAASVVIAVVLALGDIDRSPRSRLPVGRRSSAIAAHSGFGEKPVEVVQIIVFVSFRPTVVRFDFLPMAQTSLYPLAINEILAPIFHVTRAPTFGEGFKYTEGFFVGSCNFAFDICLDEDTCAAVAVIRRRINRLVIPP